jgi:hypothetical protein
MIPGIRTALDVPVRLGAMGGGLLIFHGVMGRTVCGFREKLGHYAAEEKKDCGE